MRSWQFLWIGSATHQADAADDDSSVAAAAASAARRPPAAAIRPRPRTLPGVYRLRALTFDFFLRPWNDPSIRSTVAYTRR
jgi:hypothetical protein